MGRGYLVDANQESAIRSAISRYFVLSFVVAIVGANIFGLRALLLIAPLLGRYWLSAAVSWVGLPVSPARMTYGAAGRAQVPSSWVDDGLAALFGLSVTS